MFLPIPNKVAIPLLYVDYTEIVKIAAAQQRAGKLEAADWCVTQCKLHLAAPSSMRECGFDGSKSNSDAMGYHCLVQLYVSFWS